MIRFPYTRHPRTGNKIFFLYFKRSNESYVGNLIILYYNIIINIKYNNSLYYILITRRRIIYCCINESIIQLLNTFFFIGDFCFLHAICSKHVIYVRVYIMLLRYDWIKHKKKKKTFLVSHKTSNHKKTKYHDINIGISLF